MHPDENLSDKFKKLHINTSGSSVDHYIEKFLRLLGTFHNNWQSFHKIAKFIESQTLDADEETVFMSKFVIFLEALTSQQKLFLWELIEGLKHPLPNKDGSSIVHGHVYPPRYEYLLKNLLNESQLSMVWGIVRKIGYLPTRKEASQEDYNISHTILNINTIKHPDQIDIQNLDKIDLEIPQELSDRINKEKSAEKATDMLLEWQSELYKPWDVPQIVKHLMTTLEDTHTKEYVLELMEYIDFKEKTVEFEKRNTKQFWLQKLDPEQSKALQKLIMISLVSV